MAIKLTDDKSFLTNTYMYQIELGVEKIPVLFKDDIYTKLNIPD